MVLSGHHIYYLNYRAPIIILSAHFTALGRHRFFSRNDVQHPISLYLQSTPMSLSFHSHHTYYTDTVVATTPEKFRGPCMQWCHGYFGWMSNPSGLFEWYSLSLCILDIYTLRFVARSIIYLINIITVKPTVQQLCRLHSGTHCRIRWAFRKEICASRNVILAERGGVRYIDFSHEGVVGQGGDRSTENEPLDRISEDAEEKPGEWYAVFTCSFCCMLFLGMIRTDWRWMQGTNDEKIGMLTELPWARIKPERIIWYTPSFIAFPLPLLAPIYFGAHN